MREVSERYYQQPQRFQPWLRSVENTDELPDLPEPITLFDRQNKQSHLLDTDIQKVAVLQERFNSALSIIGNEQLSYNPVLARWKYEQCYTPEERLQFRIYEQKQIETAIRERWETAESKYTYPIDDEGKLRSEFFPDEPFETVLLRGVKAREKDNSRELEREKSEVVGILKIEQIATDPQTPLDTKVYSFSRPSTEKETPYVHNFVDEFVVAEDPKTKKRIVSVTRFECDMTEEECEEIVRSIDPHYFDQQIGKRDAWYLANPLVGDVMNKVKKKNTAMKEEVFQTLSPFLAPAGLYVLDTICAEAFDPPSIAEAWNALLAESDEIKARGESLLKKTDNTNVIFSAIVDSHPTFTSQYERARWYAARPIAEVRAGCGISGGFGMFSNGEAKSASLKNSVSQFATQEWFKCPKCPFEANGPIGDNPCPGCGLTKEEYVSEEGAVVCD